MIFDLSSDEITKACGGKAYSINKLIINRFSCPSGFVITSNFFESINKKFSKISNITIKEDSTLQFWIDKIYSSLDDKVLLAVRSSFSLEDGDKSAYAGMFSSYLAVDKSSVYNKIIDCYHSFLNERINHYTDDFRSGNMNVICQKMINPKYSGVAFSKNVISDSSNEIIIEVCIGLGELLVSGVITPMTIFYNIEKGIISEQYESIQTIKRVIQNEKLVDVSTSSLELSAFGINEIQLISKNLKKLVRLYQKHVDVEWCIDQQNQLHLLQCRPITTR